VGKKEKRWGSRLCNCTTLLREGVEGGGEAFTIDDTEYSRGGEWVRMADYEQNEIKRY